VGAVYGPPPFIEVVLDELEAKAELKSCWDCGALMEVDENWPTICERCWSDVQAGRWPRRDRVSEGDRRRRKER